MEDFRDDELKKWLAEEYEKEIDEMEEVLFPNGVLPDDGETEEEAKAAYKKLVDRLKADGVYEEDEPEKVKIVYLPEKKRHKAAKVAAAVLVCAAGVFAASMTSQANRSYFIDSVKVWTGNDTKIVVDNDKTNDPFSDDEDSAISDIEEQLDVHVPYIMYRPKNFEFKDYNVSKVSGYAVLQYRYKDSILSIYIKLKEDNIEVQIKKIMSNGDKKASYVAYWNTDTEFYQIECQMPEKEFIKVIENMKF